MFPAIQVGSNLTRERAASWDAFSDESLDFRYELSTDTNGPQHKAFKCLDADTRACMTGEGAEVRVHQLIPKAFLPGSPIHPATPCCRMSCNCLAWFSTPC